MIEIPKYFKNSYEHLQNTLKTVRRGRVTEGCKTPGGRVVYMVEYGEAEQGVRTANYSSALGSGDVRCYSNKKRPCVMIIGGVHGGEFEGIAAILNLISILEHGRDLRGNQNHCLLRLAQSAHLILVPCANADGRARVPLESFVGENLATLRYYNQGEWENGGLCGYPICKRVHPMRGTSFLGGYFNDDGVNLMHDNFFEPMAKETGFLLRMAEKYAPDVILNLHGAANMGYGMYFPSCAADPDRAAALAFEARMCGLFTMRGWRYINTDCSNTEAEFSLTTAFYLCCGALSVTWESYQGVLSDDEESISCSVCNDILETHMTLFEEAFRFAAEKHRKEQQRRI